MTDRENKIRQRAYGIWQEEGYPHGRAEDHWHRAAREVTEESEAAAPAQGELIPHIGEAPSLQPADAPPAKKAAVPRRTTAKKPAAASAAPADLEPKTKSRARATATRKPTVKKS